jgi:hypothetical protein
MGSWRGVSVARPPGDVNRTPAHAPYESRKEEHTAALYEGAAVSASPSPEKRLTLGREIARMHTIMPRLFYVEYDLGSKGVPAA